MCYGIAFEIGIAGDTLLTWAGDPAEMGAKRDGHDAIRAFHGLSKVDGGAASTRRAPVEMHPTKLEALDSYALVWDEGSAPAWWDDDEHMPQLRRALAREVGLRLAHARETGVWAGVLIGVVALPDYVTCVGGGLDLFCATLPDGAFAAIARVGGYLYLRGATLPDGAFGAMASVGGYLYLRNATLPDGAFPALAHVGGDLDVGGTTVSGGAFPALENVGDDLYLSGATVLGGAFPTLYRIGGDLDVDCATIPDAVLRRLTEAEKKGQQL
jgi:hypothetical protein